MLDALDTSGTGNAGALALAMGKSRGQKIADRAHAIQQGSAVGSMEEIENKVRGVAEDFVSVFMNQVMKSMRATVPENPSMHGDNGEKFFQEMLDTEQSKYLAKGSGYGLTDLIYESMMTSYRVREQTEVSGAAAAAADRRDEHAAFEAEEEAAAERETEPVAALE